MLIHLLASLAASSAPMASQPNPNAIGVNVSVADQPNSQPKPPASGTKQCPDGVVIRTSDSCPVMPDHRFEITHEPQRQERMRRWWCDGRSGKNEVSMLIEYGRRVGTGSSGKQMIKLSELIINGRPSTLELKKSIQEQINSFDRFDAFNGRCLLVRSGGTIPVLGLHGVAMKGGKLEPKHEEIPLAGQ